MQPNELFLELRNKLSLTQLEFSKKIGVSRSTIADIERGSIPISKRVMSKIVQNLDIETGYFDRSETKENEETKQGSETGLRQGLESSELRKRATNRINKLINSIPKYLNTDGLSDEEILKINSQEDDSNILNNLSQERLLSIGKLFEKQKVIAEKVISTIAVEDADYRTFRSDILAIQSFENVLDNLINSDGINELIKIKDSARHYPNMNFSDLKAALKHDFQAFKPYLKAFSELANALKAFTDKAQRIPEAVTGIDAQEFKNYLELNADMIIEWK